MATIRIRVPLLHGERIQDRDGPMLEFVTYGRLISLQGSGWVRRRPRSKLLASYDLDDAFATTEVEI